MAQPPSAVFLSQRRGRLSHKDSKKSVLDLCLCFAYTTCVNCAVTGQSEIRFRLCKHAVSSFVSDASAVVYHSKTGIPNRSPANPDGIPGLIPR